MADKIIFNLDGNSVEAEPGETIWEVAKKTRYYYSSFMPFWQKRLSVRWQL